MLAGAGCRRRTTNDSPGEVSRIKICLCFGQRRYLPVQMRTSSLTGRAPCAHRGVRHHCPAAAAACTAPDPREWRRARSPLPDAMNSMDLLVVGRHISDGIQSTPPVFFFYRRHDDAVIFCCWKPEPLPSIFMPAYQLLPTCFGESVQIIFNVHYLPPTVMTVMTLSLLLLQRVM